MLIAPRWLELERMIWYTMTSGHGHGRPAQRTVGVPPRDDEDSTMATTTVAPRRTFFDRMVAKSEEQVRAGNLPRWLRSLPQASNGDLTQVWSVASRQTAGEVHIVEVVQPTDGREVVVNCDCPA